MSDEELKQNLWYHSHELHIPIEKLRVIPKSELLVGKEYDGECRNSGKATWCGNYFEYERYKLGSHYTDRINHYEDDDGYDVFVPIEVIE